MAGLRTYVQENLMSSFPSISPSHLFKHRKKSRGKKGDSGYRNQQSQLPLRGQYWLKPVSRLMLRRLSNRFF